MDAGGDIDAGGDTDALFMSPTELRFETPCGEPAPGQAVSLTNRGARPVNWTAAVSEPTAFSLDNSGAVLAPGATAFITVSTLRSSSGNGVLTITTDVAARPTLTANLYKEDTGAYISGLPAVVDFGSVPVGTSQRLTVRPTSISHRVYIMPSGWAVPFSLYVQPNYPPPDTYLIDFAPTMPGTYAQTFTFVGIARPVCAPNSFVVRGTGY